MFKPILLTSQQHIADVTALYLSHRLLQRSTHHKYKTDILEWLDAGLDIYGVYSENNELLAFCTHKLITGIPIHRIGNVFIKQKHFNQYHFKDPLNPVPSIIDTMLARAENLGYYTWYYSRANLPVYARLEQRSQDMLRWCKYGYDESQNEYRYTKYIDEKIAPFSSSSFNSFNKMFLLGDNQHELLIFQCNLKQQYRS